MELEERVAQLKEQNLEPKEIARAIIKETPEIDLHVLADAVGITFEQARSIKGALVRIKELPSPGRGFEPKTETGTRLYETLNRMGLKKISPDEVVEQYERNQPRLSNPVEFHRFLTQYGIDESGVNACMTSVFGYGWQTAMGPQYPLGAQPYQTPWGPMPFYPPGQPAPPPVSPEIKEVREQVSRLEGMMSRIVDRQVKEEEEKEFQRRLDEELGRRGLTRQAPRTRIIRQYQLDENGSPVFVDGKPVVIGEVEEPIADPAAETLSSLQAQWDALMRRLDIGEAEKRGEDRVLKAVGGAPGMSEGFLIARDRWTRGERLGREIITEAREVRRGIGAALMAHLQISQGVPPEQAYASAMEMLKPSSASLAPTEEEELLRRLTS